MQAALILFLILAILLVIFTLQNSVEITINVFFWEISHAPLVLVILICIAIGYLLASVFFFPRIWKLRKENKQLVKTNKELTEKTGNNPNKGHEPGKTIEFDDDNPEGISLEDDESSRLFDE